MRTRHSAIILVENGTDPRKYGLVGGSCGGTSSVPAPCDSLSSVLDDWSPYLRARMTTRLLRIPKTYSLFWRNVRRFLARVNC